jgi:TatD-related deoxyribonuclease
MTNPISIFDNHIHLRVDHRGVEAAKDFERFGGTAIMLTHAPYDDLPIRDGSDYARAFDRTLEMAEAVRRQTSLRVFVALGPYPVDLLSLAKDRPIAEAAEALTRGVDIAAEHIAEGRATAFGEVGRPHFPSPPEIMRTSNAILEYTMSRARALGCAVIIHSEDPTPATFSEFAGIARRAGLSPDRVVKHHSTPFTRPEDTQGIIPSILAKEDLALAALRGGPRFLLETDYIDDPRRPGAVLGPATVPRKTKAWLAQGLLTEDQASIIHREMPERTYGIQIR